MTQQPFPPSALRGAVDLSALKRPAPRSPAGAAGPTGPGGAGAAAGGGETPQQGLVITGSDATFQDIVNASIRYPVVVVLWSSQLAESGDFVKVMGGLAASNQGRFQVVSVDVADNPADHLIVQVEAALPLPLGVEGRETSTTAAGLVRRQGRPQRPFIRGHHARGQAHGWDIVQPLVPLDLLDLGHGLGQLGTKSKFTLGKAGLLDAGLAGRVVAVAIVVDELIPDEPARPEPLLQPLGLGGFRVPLLPISCDP